MERLIVALVIAAVVGSVALVVRRRRVPDVPTQRRRAVPEQLDRSRFPHPETPWLVAVFTSATCDVCRGVLDKAAVLVCDEVTVADIEYTAERSLHEQYAIDAVPTLVVANADGVVVASFVGPMTATDLWAAVAEARDPGSTPRQDSCH